MKPEFSTIKTNFLNEVEENKGSLRHDFTNPLHYEYVLASLGGKEFLQKNYPHLFNLFEKSKREQLTAKANGGMARTEDVNGFSAYEDIKYISLNSDNLQSGICANYPEQKPSIAFSGTLTETLPNGIEHIVGMVNAYGEESYILEDAITVPISELVESDDKIFKTAADIYHLDEKADNGLSLASCTKVYKDVKIIGKNNIVANFTVNAPIPIKTPSRDHVVVVYNREAYLEDNDYSYNNGPDPEKKLVPVFMPASATVTLTNDWQILRLDENIGHLLDLEDLNKGIVVNYSGYESCQINDNQITWTFKQDWQNKLNISNFQAGTTVQIYCKVGIYIKNKTTGMEMPIPLVFQSKITKSADKSFAVIKPIWIQWGCVGKDTLILMADHTPKKVADIKIGDLIFNENKEVVQVKNIYTGLEETMILLKTQSQKQVLVTDGHPVSTSRGILPARCLRASDRIKTADGYEDIIELHNQPYHDTVYSLAFEKENCIICNGMVLGDFGIQQTAKDPQEEPVPITRSEECIEVRKEFKKLMEELNSKKQEFLKQQV